MGETSQFILRKLTTDDSAAAAVLDKKCFCKRDAFSRKYFFYAALNLRYEFFVVETDGKIIACAGAEIQNDAAEIQTIATDPNYRGLGIGTKIFSKLIETIKERGATLVYLEVRPSNTPAINLYENFGFRVVDSIENFYGNEDALIMMRSL